MPDATTPVLLSGLPGAMAAEVARLVVDAGDLTLAPIGLTSASHDGERFETAGGEVALRTPGNVGADAIAALAVAVDYSTPDAALANIAWLAERGVSMVVGTTGFDSDEARRVVEASDTVAVIAPNMAVPIVLLQAATRYLAETFPGALAGGEVSITESHQQAKRDTSGTAKWMAAALTALGLPIDESGIRQIRDPDVQREAGIPAEHLDGHACHWYRIAAAGGTVELGLEHGVMGRRVYAEGTLAAVRFVAARRRAGAAGVAYTMEDVLRGV